MAIERSSNLPNVTFVRPAQFYLSGLFDFPHGKYFYIFLCFVYIMTVLGNFVLLLIIFLVRALHTPKYMIVFNLAVTDLCGSTALIPKLLDTFLFDNRSIIYEACLSYMFYVLFFGSVQSWTLVTMAYDRFIAICFPLYYHRIVTKPTVAVMLFFVWLLALSVIGSLVILINRLSFCKSLVIQSFYCDHGSVLQLACNSVFVNGQLANFAAAIMLFVPFVLIAFTYVCIAFALRKTVRKKSLKALKTCTSHLMLVAILFIPIISTNIAVLSSHIHPNTRMVNSTLTHTVPSLLNPFIYSLKTEQILTVIKRFCKRCRQNHKELVK